MSKKSYERGFVKAAQAHGVDPVALAKYLQKTAARYTPMYATQHQIGSLKSNWDAAKNWAKGNGPAMNASFATVVSNDDLTHDMSSISAPTAVDRLHNWWNSFRGKGDIYGTTDHGKPISPQRFDSIVQGARSRNPGIRAPRPGEYDGSWTQNSDGSFSKGNTTSYPLEPIDISGVK